MGIQSKELRIGNLVNIENRFGDIVQIEIHGISSRGNIYDEDDSAFSCDELIPIIITEEWLVKFGFKKIKGRVNYEDAVIYFRKDSFMYWCFKYNLCLCYLDRYLEYSSYSNVDIKHVHQLQNLYFALTNEELTIK
jgi:hypothetical protein